MSETWTVLSAVLPVFALVTVGLILRKLNWLTAAADASLLRVTINVLYPCLILDAALGNPALADINNLALAPVVGFSTAVVGMLLALATRRFNGTRHRAEARTFALSTGVYNYGFIPIPLAMLMFGDETVGVLCVHNVGVDIAIWSVGILLLTGTGLGTAWRKIINAPLLAIVTALSLNGLGYGDRIPPVVATILGWLSDCAIPMSLILVGATLADHLGDFHAAHGWRVMASALILRLGVLPMGFVLLAKFLPASVELKRVIVLEASMASAIFPIVLSRHYGGDPATAVRIALATSAMSLLTMPFWISFGMKWVGL